MLIVQSHSKGKTKRGDDHGRQLGATENIVLSIFSTVPVIRPAGRTALKSRLAIIHGLASVIEERLTGNL